MKYVSSSFQTVAFIAVFIVGQSSWNERNEDTIMNSAKAISTKEKTTNVI